MDSKKRLALITKLISQGYDDENKIANIDIKALLDTPGISVPELKEIIGLQENIKKKNLFNWLFKGE